MPKGRSCGKQDTQTDGQNVHVNLKKSSNSRTYLSLLKQTNKQTRDDKIKKIYV